MFLGALVAVWPLTAMGVSFGVAFLVFLSLCVLVGILKGYSEVKRDRAKSRAGRKASSR